MSFIDEETGIFHCHWCDYQTEENYFGLVHCRDTHPEEYDKHMAIFMEKVRKRMKELNSQSSTPKAIK